MLEITREISVARRLDIPGVQEPLSPGEYRLVCRIEVDPIDEGRVYHDGGELIRIEDGRRYLLWGHQVEALLQSPHVTIAEPVSTS
jgi:hypothetical protein